MARCGVGTACGHGQEGDTLTVRCPAPASIRIAVVSYGQPSVPCTCTGAQTAAVATACNDGQRHFSVRPRAATLATAATAAAAAALALTTQPLPTAAAPLPAATIAVSPTSEPLAAPAQPTAASVTAPPATAPASPDHKRLWLAYCRVCGDEEMAGVAATCDGKLSCSVLVFPGRGNASP
ncbi:hypothetical protein ABPG75_014047 [Micractinium tetrahymenae]